MTVIDNSTGRPLGFDANRTLDGVRSRRIMAVLIDWAIVIALCIPVAIVIFFLGLATLGLGFALYGAMFPVLALAYSGFTLGGQTQATMGMRLMDIHVERLSGERMDFVTAVAHTFLFWASVTILTPLVLAVTLFADKKRALHDMLTDSLVMRGAL